MTISHCTVGALALAFGLATTNLAAAPAESATRPPADPLLPATLVDQVLAANPGIESLNNALDAAVARITPAGALDDPTFSYAIAPASVGVTGLDTGHIVGFSQPLPWPGKRSARADVARANASLAASDLALLRRRAAQAARQAFADWHYLHAALAANAAQQRVLGELVETARGLYRSGGGSQQAVLSAQLRRTQRTREALTLQARRDALAARINALRDQPPTRQLGEPGPLPRLPTLPPQPRLLAALSRTSPQLAALDARATAAESAEALARLDYRPDLRLTANYLGTLPRDENRAQIGVAVNLPFGLGGRDKRDAALDAARADVARVRAQRRDRAGQLSAQLADHVASERAARQTLALYDTDLLPLARQTLDAALADYASGNGDVRDVIDAETDLLDARLGAAAAASETYRQRAAIVFLTGGELEPELLGDTR